MRFKCTRPALFVTIGLLSAATVRADDPRVTIAGGIEPDNPQFYSWDVSNHHDQPIVSIQFDHYRADTLECPGDWSQEWKNRAMVGGGKDAPGWVRASVANPVMGIPAGRAARFRMRISRGDVLARPGKAVVRFADGTEVVVTGVEVPSAQTTIERNAMVIGMALIFAAALLLHARSRKGPQAEATTTAASPSPPRDSTH